jgi:methyl-accepting chemotaxis protein
LFLLAGIAALAAAIGITALSSHSIARPLAGMVARLRHCTATGDLPEFAETSAGPLEIRDLSDSFNQAAKAVRESRERLTRA